MMPEKQSGLTKLPWGGKLLRIFQGDSKASKHPKENLGFLQSNKMQKLQNSCEYGKMGTSGFSQRLACNAKKKRTTDSLMLDCPVTRLKGGVVTVSEYDEGLDSWIEIFKLDM